MDSYLAELLELQTLKTQKEDELSQFESDWDSTPYSDQFDELLDSEGPVVICGISYDKSRIMKEIDEPAYYCELATFAEPFLREKKDRLQDEIDAIKGDIEYHVARNQIL